MKIVTVVGARPQFIKAGSVSREILSFREKGIDIEEIIIHTGQHYDSNMSDVFFDEMKIPKPNYFLGVGGKSHGAMTGQMIEKIEEILIIEKPDFVMVYGDTNSTLAGALAASKLHIKIAHVEAGLRSFNMTMPEEINRILTDRISRLLFCPTQIAMDNLQKESISDWNTGANAVCSGDVMYDGVIFYKQLAEKPLNLNINDDFILCTIHRAENTDDLSRLKNILYALNKISQEKKIILPLHPRTKKILLSLDFDLTNISIIEPVGYLNMIWLINNCDLVMTDSGGLQKEAFFFGKPCLTLRDETEWIELVNMGVNKLVGAKTDRILQAYKEITDIDISKIDINPYGNGSASKAIVEGLIACV